MLEAILLVIGVLLILIYQKLKLVYDYLKEEDQRNFLVFDNNFVELQKFGFNNIKKELETLDEKVHSVDFDELKLNEAKHLLREYWKTDLEYEKDKKRLNFIIESNLAVRYGQNKIDEILDFYDKKFIIHSMESFYEEEKFLDKRWEIWKKDRQLKSKK